VRHDFVQILGTGRLAPAQSHSQSRRGIVGVELFWFNHLNIDIQPSELLAFKSAIRHECLEMPPAAGLLEVCATTNKKSSDNTKVNSNVP
jgi:hypothetical protein